MANMTASTTSISFGSVALAASASSSVTLTNNLALLNPITYVLTGTNPTDFFLTPRSNFPIYASTTGVVGILFKPFAAGARSATLTITDSTGTIMAVTLTGTGVATTASVSPNSLSFAETSVGVTTASKSFTITNTSLSSIVLTGLAYTDGIANDVVTQPQGIGKDNDFTVTPASGSFPFTVTAGSTKVFNVTFNPKRSSAGWDIRATNVSVLNNSGINITVGLGGGVLEPGFDFPTSHPATGLPSSFGLADMDSGYHNPIYLLGTPHSVKSTLVTGVPDPLQPIIVAGTGVTSATTGSYVTVNGRSIQVDIEFADITQGCDLKIFANTTGGDLLVGTWIGRTYANVGGLFIGNATGVDLQGLQLKAQILNLINSKQIWVSVVVLA